MPTTPTAESCDDEVVSPVVVHPPSAKGDFTVTLNKAPNSPLGIDLCARGLLGEVYFHHIKQGSALLAVVNVGDALLAVNGVAASDASKASAAIVAAGGNISLRVRSSGSDEAASRAGTPRRSARYSLSAMLQAATKGHHAALLDDSYAP